MTNAKNLRADLNQAMIEGNKAVKESVDWVNKEYLATDRVAGAEDRLRQAREQSRKIAESGDKEAIANARKLVLLREKDLEAAKRRRNRK